MAHHESSYLKVPCCLLGLTQSKAGIKGHLEGSWGKASISSGAQLLGFETGMQQVAATGRKLCCLRVHVLEAARQSVWPCQLQS